uniref:Cas scaffold protein family member 4 n=1 Tax=Varanus komodoensis TaxID=61221 RepID=A0A8D2LDA5_VARKO
VEGTVPLGFFICFFDITLAKALYDNKAECPDELAFRRGDILTVLEQNLLGSEGWWKCSLHGKQGLAPANRLQLLTPFQTPSTLLNSQGLPTNPQTIYQVPSAHKLPAPLPIYEKMDGWITPPPPSSSASSPITQEECKAPALGLATPPSSRKGSCPFPTTECFLENAQRLYDIPPNPEKARVHTWQECPLDNVRTSQRKHPGHFKTLPNLRKSEWIYDIPVSPEKTELKQTSQTHSANKHVIYDTPPARFDSGMPKIPSSDNKDKSAGSEIYDVPPIQRKCTFPEIPLYDVPSTHDVLLQHQNGNYNIPSAALSCRTEKEKHQENLYDIPKGMPTALLPKKENTVSNYSGDNMCVCSPQSSTDGKVDQDRLSVSSVDSRTSSISTLSSSSTESFSSTVSSSTPPSSSEEPSKETTMDLESAIETLTKLQHSVSSSIASLMIFVSSRWRHQEHLEGNIEEIHRAVDHIKVSLGEFLDFARTIEGNASWSSDSKLQKRFKKQLDILTDSFQILVETRDALNNCKWSLKVLVIKKPQSNPDDLDRFVMVARTIPDDIKRFVSIIVANGKLLFRKNGKEKDAKARIAGPLNRNETTAVQYRTTPNSRQSSDCCLKPWRHADCQSKSHWTRWKMVLSSICRLYFGAVQKAIAVFLKSLDADQTPEVFIAKSKLIIMVGQKLVDALCQEALKKTNRNEILCGSCNFCALLKNLAIATKNAAMQYPSPEAMRELQDQVDGLSKYIQQFRAMME